jgi:hypothetical protein
MKRLTQITLAIILFLALAVPGWAATYYVSPTGSNTPPYDTWAKAANLSSTAITAGNAGGGPHTVYIAPGTYDDYLVLTDADWVGGNVIGTSAHGVTTPAVKGQVLINHAAHSLLTASIAVTVKNLSFTGADAAHNAFVITNANGFVGDNLYIYDCNATILSAAVGTTNATITNSTIGGTLSTVGVAIYGGHTTGTITFSYCLIKASNKNYLTNSLTTDQIKNAGAGVLTFNNCLISGGRRSHLSVSAGTLNLNNNVILPTTNGGIATVTQSGTGTLNLTANIILGDWYGTTHPCVSGTLNTDVGNIYKIHRPIFTKQQRVGYVIPCVDDSSDSVYAKLVETELQSRGMKGTWACDAYAAVNTPAYKTEIQGMVDRGVMSIGGHGYSHTDLTTTGNACTITKVGATINVDRAGDVITITPGGTVTGFKAKTLAAIKTELEGLGCTYGSVVGTNTLGESMSDSTGAQASPYSPQLLIDTTAATGFFNVELVQAKALMEANFTGLTLKALVTPGSSNSADVRTATKASGFWGSRSVKTVTGNTFLLNSLNAYGISHLQFNTYWRGATDADTKANIYAFLEAVSSNGIVLAILAHSTTECTQAEWQMLLDACAEYSTIKVTDLDTFLTDLRALWATADDITYTKDATDQSDYRLTPVSPAINAGVDVGLTSDFAGNPVPQGPYPDIGIYEHSSQAADPFGHWLDRYLP